MNTGYITLYKKANNLIIHKNKGMRKHLWHISLLFIHYSEVDEQTNILTKGQNKLSGKTLWKPEYYF